VVQRTRYSPRYTWRPSLQLRPSPPYSPSQGHTRSEPLWWPVTSPKPTSGHCCTGAKPSTWHLGGHSRSKS
jgi:hypothetical protein